MQGTVAEFAPAKINLALHVLGRRADGYHELDSVVVFADAGDRLTFTPAETNSVVVAGPFAAGLPPANDNIVLRAWAAVDKLAGGIAPVAVTIEKNLPVASGIGGGSANAAATLRALLGMNAVTVDATTLRTLALSLGADVPVCLAGRASSMRGVGERIESLAGLGPFDAVLVNPGVAVPTPEVFRAFGLERGVRHRPAIADVTDTGSMRNDLTEAAIALAPAIAEVLGALQQQPELTVARMSGSGATCFGLFETRSAAARAASALRREHPSWWVTACRLQ